MVLTLVLHCVSVQSQLEKLVAKNYFLNKSAKDGYRAYIQSYASHGLKHIFDVHKLDLLATSRAFGFQTPPRVNLNIKARSEPVRRRGGGGGFGKEAHKFGSSGHKFSASNPYGKRAAGDKRQFTR